MEPLESRLIRTCCERKAGSAARGMSGRMHHIFIPRRSLPAGTPHCYGFCGRTLVRYGKRVSRGFTQRTGVLPSNCVGPRGVYSNYLQSAGSVSAAMFFLNEGMRLRVQLLRVSPSVSSLNRATISKRSQYLAVIATERPGIRLCLWSAGGSNTVHHGAVASQACSGRTRTRPRQ